MDQVMYPPKKASTGSDLAVQIVIQTPNTASHFRHGKHAIAPNTKETQHHNGNR